MKATETCPPSPRAATSAARRGRAHHPKILWWLPPAQSERTPTPWCERWLGDRRGMRRERGAISPERVRPRRGSRALCALKAYRAELGRVLINRQPNADLDVPPNVRSWGKRGHAAGLSVCPQSANRKCPYSGRCNGGVWRPSLLHLQACSSPTCDAPSYLGRQNAHPQYHSGGGSPFLLLSQVRCVSWRAYEWLLTNLDL